MRLKAWVFLGVIETFITATEARGFAFPATARTEPLLVAQFPAVGEVCLDAEHQRELIDAIIRARIPSDALVTLVAYSDRMEMREDNWEGGAPCVNSRLPGFMRGHERIAALRAYHVISLGRQAGVAPFMNAPVLTFGPQPMENLHLHSAGNLHIVPMRTDGSGPRHRKVEIHWSQPDATLPPPPSAPPEVPGARPDSLKPQTAANQPHAQPFLLIQQSWEGSVRGPLGLSSLAIGLASVGLGVSLVALAGARTNDALGILEPTRRTTQSAQADTFGVAGGASLALGVGLSAAGLIIARPWRAWPPPGTQWAQQTPIAAP